MTRFPTPIFLLLSFPCVPCFILFSISFHPCEFLISSLIQAVRTASFAILFPFCRIAVDFLHCLAVALSAYHSRFTPDDVVVFLRACTLSVFGLTTFKFHSLFFLHWPMRAPLQFFDDLILRVSLTRLDESLNDPYICSSRTHTYALTRLQHDRNPHGNPA